MDSLLSYALLGIIVILLALNLQATSNSEPINVTTQEVNVTKTQETDTLRCPKPESPDVDIEVKDYPDGITNPDYSTEVSVFQDRTAEVEGIDITGKIWGDSMHPSLQDGDKLLMEEYESKDQLQEGAIIRFDGGDNYMIHRITSDYKEVGHVVTSGDKVEYKEKVNLTDITHVVKGVVYQ